jgi:peptidoglycan hydrolase-like protein with peptidoglycan-binding domain
MLEQIDYSIEVTGYYDVQTSLALSAFQTAAGLRSTGEFDDLTWVELREALDRASREQDDQLNYARELISKPGLMNIIGGND